MQSNLICNFNKTMKRAIKLKQWPDYLTKYEQAEAVQKSR